MIRLESELTEPTCKKAVNIRYMGIDGPDTASPWVLGGAKPSLLMLSTPEVNLGIELRGSKILRAVPMQAPDLRVERPLHRTQLQRRRTRAL
jgi:hypothetical protein